LTLPKTHYTYKLKKQNVDFTKLETLLNKQLEKLEAFEIEIKPTRMAFKSKKTFLNYTFKVECLIVGETINYSFSYIELTLISLIFFVALAFLASNFFSHYFLVSAFSTIIFFFFNFLALKAKIINLLCEIFEQEETAFPTFDSITGNLICPACGTITTVYDTYCPLCDLFLHRKQTYDLSRYHDFRLKYYFKTKKNEKT